MVDFYLFVYLHVFGFCWPHIIWCYVCWFNADMISASFDMNCLLAGLEPVEVLCLNEFCRVDFHLIVRYCTWWRCMSLSQGTDGVAWVLHTWYVSSSSRIPDQIVRDNKSSWIKKTWLVLVWIERSGIMCSVVFTYWPQCDQFLALLLQKVSLTSSLFQEPNIASSRAKVSKAVKKQNAKRKARGHEISLAI